jgi:tRNA(Ile)-lysidine synthase TilS/MesJ
MDPINRMDKMEVAFIRPLSYVREKDIRELCKSLEIPFSPCLCPI